MLLDIEDRFTVRIYIRKYPLLFAILYREGFRF